MLVLAGRHYYIASAFTMKGSARHIVLFFVTLCSVTAYGQLIGNIDSLKKVLHEQKEDTNKVKLLYNLSFLYVADLMLTLPLCIHAKRCPWQRNQIMSLGIFWSEITLGEALAVLGNYPLAWELKFKIT